MAKIILVLGVSGVGKSTVVNGAVSGMGIKVQNFGDLMFDELIKAHPGLDRDMIKNLPFEEIKRAQDAAIDRLNSEDGIIALDNHMSIESPHGFYPGLSLDQGMKMNIIRIVLIEASPESILERRSKDQSRKRVKQSVDMLKAQMDIDRAMASKAHHKKSFLGQAQYHELKQHDETCHPKVLLALNL
jgi:adenylate kinase